MKGGLKMFGFAGNNLFTIIILILIVLQWFRVGGGIGGGVSPEGNLTCNGGLFIITLFILIACSCGQHYPVSPIRYC
jgi:uncharacterized membrane protein